MDRRSFVAGSAAVAASLAAAGYEPCRPARRAKRRRWRPGITPVTTTPAEFDTFFRAEAARWAKVYKDSGIKLD